MKLIREEIEDTKVITEEKDGAKTLFITGPFLVSETKNRNGRVYPKNILDNEVNRYIKEHIETGKSWGELSHPTDAKINPDRISHRIVELKEEGNIWYGKARVVDTPCGNIVKGLLDSGGTIGVSSRGVGSLKEHNGVNIVQNDYHIITAADTVLDPSFLTPSGSGAWVQGIYEEKEYLFVDGKIEESVIKNYKKEIDKAVRQKNIEEVSLKIFENFLNRVSKI